MERAPKREVKKGEQMLPSMPMEQILKMDGDALDEIAARAGMTRAKLVDLAVKNVRRKEEMTKIRESQDQNNAGLTRYMLPVSEGTRKEITDISAEAEALLNALYYSEKANNAGAKQEKKLEKLLTRVYATEKHDKIYEIYKAGGDIQEAFWKVNKEFSDRAERSSNQPAVQRALRANVSERGPKQLGSHDLSTGYEGGKASGSAEYFSATEHINYRKNPRPRRFNDELGHG